MADTDDLVGIYGALGLILFKIKTVLEEVEQLRADVRRLIDAQKQVDDDN